MPVKAGVIRAAERQTRRGAAETFTGTVFQDPVLTANAPSRMGGSVVTFTPGDKWEHHTFALTEFRDNTGKDLTMIIFAGGVEHGAFEYQIDEVVFD